MMFYDACQCNANIFFIKDSETEMGMLRLEQLADWRIQTANSLSLNSGGVLRR